MRSVGRRRLTFILHGTDREQEEEEEEEDDADENKSLYIILTFFSVSQNNALAHHHLRDCMYEYQKTPEKLRKMPNQPKKGMAMCHTSSEMSNVISLYQLLAVTMVVTVTCKCV